MSKEKLGSFLKEVSNWSWEEFVRAENDPKYTTNQSIIFSLVRACAMEKMEAIRMSLNRIDGKLKTPVRIEHPRIFYIFPNVIPTASDQKAHALSNVTPALNSSPVEGEIIPAPEIPEETHTADDLPTMGLRDTLNALAETPREMPEHILRFAEETERWVRSKGPRPAEMPRVKSVMAAHLLTMAQKRNLDAMTEVFDQIDGKLVETIHVIGEDLYITSYLTQAPEGAVLNADGIYQIEAPQVQDLWAQKLGKVGQ